MKRLLLITVLSYGLWNFAHSGFQVVDIKLAEAQVYYQDNNGNIKSVPPNTVISVSLIAPDLYEEIPGYNYKMRVDEDNWVRFGGFPSGYSYRVLLESENYWEDEIPRIKANKQIYPRRRVHIFASSKFDIIKGERGIFVPNTPDNSIIIPNIPVATNLDFPYNYAMNDTGALDLIFLFYKGSKRITNLSPDIWEDKRYADAFYIEGIDTTLNSITGYDITDSRYGIRVNGAKKDEEDPDKLLAAQMSLYLPYYNTQYRSGMRLLAPNPTERTDPFQAFLNGICAWFAYDVQGKETVSIRDINGVENTYNIDETEAKGFDSELANAKFLRRFNDPSAIWDAMYKPTLSVPHSGYNLQDLINELINKGYGIDPLLLYNLGLVPILLDATNTNTPNPTFWFDLNNIFAGTTTIQLDISKDYDFGTLIYSATPPVSFYGTSTGNHTLAEQDLENGCYVWRIKVLNPYLPNLYSDVGEFEIYEEERTKDYNPSNKWLCRNNYNDGRRESCHKHSSFNRLWNTPNNHNNHH